MPNPSHYQNYNRSRSDQRSGSSFSPYSTTRRGRAFCVRALHNQGPRKTGVFSPQIIAVYRGTSLIKNSAPIGPYSRNMPWAPWWSWWGEAFLVSEVPLYRWPFWLYLCTLVYLVIYDYGQVSLEHHLLSWYPSPESIMRCSRRRSNA